MNLAKPNAHDGETASEGRCCSTNSHCSGFSQTSIKKKYDDPAVSGILAERLNELSSEEREQIFDEIHGVAKEVQEDDNAVAASLASLEEQIQKINGPDRAAYDLAVKMNPGYVQNKAFRLMFLRADHFDVEQAATRIIKHFMYKSGLFGEQKLVKDITFDDLSNEDRASLHTGSVQYLGETDVIRDVKGRAILFQFPELVRDCDWMHNCRARWYQHMVELKDESTQRNGFVIIFFFNRSTRVANKKLTTQKIVSEAIPLKHVCTHFCFINDKISPLIRSVLKILGKKFQKRVRIHLEESSTSCLYTLQSFGIHSETVPMGYDGRPKTGKFFQRLEKLQMLEQQRKNAAIKSTSSSHDDNSSTPSSSAALTPNNKDVLLGSGLKHPGNYALDILINKEVVIFKQARSTFEKTCVVIGAVQHVQKSGGRFLKLDNNTGYWIIADDQESCRTVSTRFRNKARKLK